MTRKQSKTILGSVLTIIIGVITYFMANSFATISYVDKQIANLEKKHDQTIGKIEKTLITIDKRVYDIWIKIPKRGVK